MNTDDQVAEACRELRFSAKRKSFVGHREINKRLKEEDTLCVRNILLKHGAGKIILKNYENKQRRLPKRVRRMLMDLVVSEIIADENWYVCELFQNILICRIMYVAFHANSTRVGLHNFQFGSNLFRC